MAKSIILISAYGRKYSSKEAVLADWEAGKDFKSEEYGYYVSIAEKEYLLKNGYTGLTFRCAGIANEFYLDLL